MAITPDGRVFAPIFVGQTTDDPAIVAAMAANPDSQFHPEYIMSHGGGWSDPFTGEVIGGVQDFFGVTHSWTQDPEHQAPGFNEAGDPVNPDGTPRNPFVLPNITRTIPGGATVGEYTEDEEGNLVPTQGSFLESAQQIYDQNMARALGSPTSWPGVGGQPPTVSASNLAGAMGAQWQGGGGVPAQTGQTGGMVNVPGGVSYPAVDAGGGTSGLAALARGSGQGEMNPFEILARTIEMAQEIGATLGEGALTLNEVQGWISDIQGAGGVASQARWNMVNSIRSAILQWRVGKQAIFDHYPEIAAAGITADEIVPVLGVGGDLNAFLTNLGADTPGLDPAETNALISEIAASFPWASELGFLELIQGLVVEGAGPEQIISEVRQSEMYNKMFPGMLGPGGVRRFGTEREYINTVDSYRKVLQEHGAYDPGQDNPMDYVAFMDAGIAPDELGSRFATYESLDRGTQDLKDAFAVYGGIDLTTDDLYQAVVSPQFREELTNNYDIGVANNPFDYETYIARAHERGNLKLVDTLEQMQASGVLTGGAVSRILAMDNELGQQIMGALFIGGDTAGGGRTLDLNELTEAYSAAIIGASATEAGFGMPTKERIEEFRQAGIQAAAVRSTYQSLAMRAPQLTGMLQRAGRGAELTRTPDVQGSATLAEQEVLGTTQELTFAKQAESARGRRAGGFQTGQQGRRFTQPGRSMGY